MGQAHGYRLSRSSRTSSTNIDESTLPSPVCPANTAVLEQVTVQRARFSPTSSSVTSGSMVTAMSCLSGRMSSKTSKSGRASSKNSRKALDAVDTLVAVAGLLCDLTMEVNSHYYVSSKHGLVDTFFQSEVEGKPLLDLVSVADRSRIEATLRNLTCTRAELQSARLLCASGIGTIESKLLLMHVRSTSNDPVYIIGVRTQRVQGLCSTLASPIETCDDLDDAFGMLADSYTPTCPIKRRFSYSSEYTSETATSMASESVFSANTAVQKPSFAPSLVYSSGASSDYPSVKIQPAKGSMSIAMRTEDQPEHDNRSNTLNYTWSTIRTSVFSELFRKGERKSRKQKRREFTVRADPSAPRPQSASMLSVTPSVPSGSLAPLRPSRLFLKENAVTQTDIAQVEMGTQTDTTHVPSTSPASRPPPGRPPSGATRHTVASKCKTIPDQGHQHSSVNYHSARRNTDGNIRRSLGRSARQGKVIDRFQVTPLNTVMFHIDHFTEYLNVHLNSMSCCSWHATVRVIAVGVAQLAEQPCRGPEWFPSNGWQCVDCACCSSIDEEECAVCGGPAPNVMA